MAGDTVQWEKSLSDYSPALGYALSYAITGPSIVDSTKITVTAGTSDWTVALPGTLTSPLLPGTYAWTAFVTLAGARTVVDEGVFTARADAAQVKAAVLSFAAQMVPVLRSEIQARITGTGSANDSYSINGRSIAKMKMAELEQLRDRYELELWRERNPSRSNPSRAIRFGYAG
jgi:hypothetical protein